MKNQVTSIEQSKRLIELGVPAERASMVWIPGYEFDALTRRFVPNDKECFLAISYGRSSLMGDNIVAAFTVADLLEVLPKAIWDDVKGWSLLVIRFRSKGFPRVGYEAEHGIIWSCGEVSLLGNIIETIDWVITNGYGLDT
jgi:hypothetical protein